MFQSADSLVMDSSSAMSAHSYRWSTGSMRMQSPLEVYQANIRLAQLIIEMLGLNELQYAYKLAASLGEHIVSRLAQNSDARIEGKLHHDRLVAQTRTTVDSILFGEYLSALISRYKGIPNKNNSQHF
ncbi:hypothetical protein FGIG_03173 [Fasciola gigantica]|uniref:Uncharacterized protein n=1 Tax=Fasciola gigantica TaxID=46835 RepID=A0A504YJZ9_FASGI|nr:hypothetical protein FGIG_03173 [Fasciola gigantica]